MTFDEIVTRSDRLSRRFRQETDECDSHHPTKALSDEMLAFIEEVRKWLPKILDEKLRHQTHVLILRMVRNLQPHVREPICFCPQEA